MPQSTHDRVAELHNLAAHAHLAAAPPTEKESIVRLTNCRWRRMNTPATPTSSAKSWPPRRVSSRHEGCRLLTDRQASDPFLHIEEVPRPEVRPGYVLLRVLACGVCRDRPAHCRRRSPAASPWTDPRPPDRGRGGGRSDCRAAFGEPRRSFLDWGHRRRLLVLPPRDGESVRSAGVHRLHGEWRVCRICAGARGLCLSAAGRFGRRSCGAVAVRRDYRLSQPAGGWGGRGGTSRALRVWQLGRFGDQHSAILEVRGLCGHAGRESSPAGCVAGGELGGAAKTRGRRWSWTGRSPSRPAARWWSAPWRRCAKAEWWRSMPSTSTDACL